MTLTSLEFPHRYADAYLRDSVLGGVPFDKSELGRSLLASSLEDATSHAIGLEDGIVYRALALEDAAAWHPIDL